MRQMFVTETPTVYMVQFDYSPKLIDVIKRIPTNPRWSVQEKAWVVQKESPIYLPDKPAKWYMEAYTQWAKRCGLVDEIKWEKDNLDYSSTGEMHKFEGDHYMTLPPYEYQLEGVQYALEKKRCIFGDQPGLGKTLQAICAIVKAHKEAQKYGESLPTLVICPASLKINWQREFKKFANIEAIILDNDNKTYWHRYIEQTNAFGEPICSVFITNYESLRKFFVKERKPGRFTMRSIVFDDRVKLFKSVIIDESHKCKSSKTQQSKYVEGICKGKDWVFELTGTPVVNHNGDLIQQLKILGRLDEFGGYRTFVARYCDGPKMSSRNKELNALLWQRCFFRREKQKVLSQLPEKSRQYIQCDISTRSEYNSAEKDMIAYLRNYKNASENDIMRSLRGEVVVKIGLLKAISARGKIKAVSEFVHDIIDGGEKFILFAYLKEVVDALKKEFPDAVTVTGSDNVKQKQEAVDKFQNDPDTKLIILNYKSGGTGLTLTAASRVGFIEFPWTYADCEQAEDRAHRNGQKNNVNCYYFIGDKTIDKYMYNVVKSKESIANQVTGTETQIDEDIINITMNLFRDKL